MEYVAELTSWNKLKFLCLPNRNGRSIHLWNIRLFASSDWMRITKIEKRHIDILCANKLKLVSKRERKYEARSHSHTRAPVHASGRRIWSSKSSETKLALSQVCVCVCLLFLAKYKVQMSMSAACALLIQKQTNWALCRWAASWICADWAKQKLKTRKLVGDSEFQFFRNHLFSSNHF